jgi:predicted RNA methylase
VLNSVVYGLDIDPSALAIAEENAMNLEVDNFELINMDIIESMGRRGELKLKKPFDTVITNPPFGAQKTNTGIDMKFVECALAVPKTPHIASITMYLI